MAVNGVVTTQENNENKNKPTISLDDPEASSLVDAQVIQDLEEHVEVWTGFDPYDTPGAPTHAAADEPMMVPGSTVDSVRL